MNDGRGGRRGSGSRRGFHFRGCCWVAQFSRYLLRACDRRIRHWVVRSEAGEKWGSRLGSYPGGGAFVTLDIPPISQGFFISHFCICCISTHFLLFSGFPWNSLLIWFQLL